MPIPPQKTWNKSPGHRVSRDRRRLPVPRCVIQTMNQATLSPAAVVDGLNGLSPVHIDPRQLQRSTLSSDRAGFMLSPLLGTDTSCVRQTARHRSSISEPGGRHQKEPCRPRDPLVQRLTLALQLHCLFTTCSVSVCLTTHTHTHQRHCS